MRIRLPLVAALLSLLLCPPVLAGGNHVRVVLDTSLSMSRQLSDGTGPNDPGRLAILATMLLYDLADPNPQRPVYGDSFEVYPFDPGWPEWTDPTAMPPPSKRPAIVAEAQTPAARAAFARALDGLAYDGNWTYFYPVLRRAFESLEGASRRGEDSRAIVLVTDGLPEGRTRERERELLAGLRARIEEAGIRLYVLAFGEVAVRNRGFFDALVRGSAGEPLGAVFVDPDGSGLLTSMLEIFSLSFGYAVDPPRRAGDIARLDLDGGVTPDKVAVVALASGPAPPSQTFAPRVNAPFGLVTSAQPGASYSLQWVLGPGVGEYAFTSDRPGASLAVLRPVRPLLQILPGRVLPDKEMRQAFRVVAGERFSLRVLVSSPAGARGSQPNVDLSFRTLGPWTGPCAFRWRSDTAPPARGSAKPMGNGVAHEIWMTFPEDEADPDRPYQGFVDLEARRGDKLVAELKCAEAHPLEVYPRLAFHPEPRQAIFSAPALGQGDRDRCVGFDLDMDRPERLAVLGAGPYGLQAHLSTPRPGALDAELAGARLRLDGQPLDFAERPATPPAPWSQGRALSAEALLGHHTLCIDMGRPKIDALSEDLPVALVMKLAHPPYDDFALVDPFEVRLSVLPPAAVPFPWQPLALVLAVAALLPFGLWLYEARRALPPDLGYTLWRAGERGHPKVRRLPPAGLLARLFGRSPPRPVADPVTGETLAWVRPDEGELFVLETAAGVHLEAADGGDVPLGSGGYRLPDAHRAYRLSAGEAQWRLRIQYL
jgi:hypothetical protein